MPEPERKDCVVTPPGTVRSRGGCRGGDHTRFAEDTSFQREKPPHREVLWFRMVSQDHPNPRGAEGPYVFEVQ